MAAIEARGGNGFIEIVIIRRWNVRSIDFTVKRFGRGGEAVLEKRVVINTVIASDPDSPCRESVAVSWHEAGVPKR
jgi:hypothetical protein